MKILLLAHEKDDHAAPVRWALTQARYEAECRGGVSAAVGEHASLFLTPGVFNPGMFNSSGISNPEVFSAANCKLEPAVVLGKMVVKRGDTVWFRQPALDLEQSQSSKFSSFWNEIVAIFELLPVRCVNKPSASKLVTNKAVQLRLAGEAGLRVPETVMSNAPTAVRELFDRYSEGAVCKPFVPHIWQRQGLKGAAVAETFTLTRAQLPANEVFTYAPAIYQRRIQKQLDVRAVLLGNRVYSFALRTPGNALDWRFDAARRNLDVEMVATPADVEKALLSFAEDSGVCFGSVDFAVDQRGDWWFLEINEQGQFLWLEEFCPRAALLQKFCAFLTADEHTAESLEAREQLFPSLADYDRAHPQREHLDFTHASADSSFKSVEP